MQPVQRVAKHGPANQAKRAKKAAGAAPGSGAGDSGLREQLDDVVLWLKINAYLASGRNAEFAKFVELMEKQCR